MPRDTGTTLGNGTCVHCEEPCDRDEYCWGCQRHVCLECSQNVFLSAEHKPEAHLEATTKKQKGR
jgi:hypothetical protein